MQLNLINDDTIMNQRINVDLFNQKFRLDALQLASIEVLKLVTCVNFELQQTIKVSQLGFKPHYFSLNI